MYDDLLDDIPHLCQVLQNTVLHVFWIGEETYGITYEQLKKAGGKICIGFNYASAKERLRNIVELDAGDPAMLGQALHLTSTHARFKMPDGHTVETGKAEFC